MTRTPIALTLLALLALPAGACTSPPVYQTYATAFGDYDRVFDATVQTLDKYSLLREVDRETGTVVGEMKPDGRFFDPTRREIVARILRRENYNEVQVRVVYSVEEGEPVGREGYAPTYQWRRLDFDKDLELKLSNEINEQLSGRAWRRSRTRRRWPRRRWGRRRKRSPSPPNRGTRTTAASWRRSPAAASRST